MFVVIFFSLKESDLLEYLLNCEDTMYEIFKTKYLKLKISIK